MVNTFPAMQRVYGAQGAPAVQIPGGRGHGGQHNKTKQWRKLARFALELVSFINHKLRFMFELLGPRS